MRQWIDKLNQTGTSGLALSIAMLGSREPWTIAPAQFNYSMSGMFESVIEKVKASRPDIGGIRAALVLEDLAYAPASARLPALVHLAREWPEGLNALLGTAPADPEIGKFRHNTVTSLVTLIAHSEQVAIFERSRVDRVAAAIAKHRGGRK